MATSLGRLTIDLAANAAGFESDMKRASKSAQREMAKVSRNLRFAQADLDKANAKLSTMATRIGAIGAVSLGLVVREFKKLGDEADRIQKIGIATGLTAEAVQELGFAAEQSGSNLESVIKGVQQLQKNIVQAQDGLATYTRAFERVGIAVEDLDGLSPEDQFLRMAQALSEVDDPTIRTATAMELLGRAGKDLIPFLAQGADGIEELREQLRSTGSVMSQETVNAAAQFNDAINLLTRQAGALKVALFSDIIEPLADLVDFLARTEEGQEALRETMGRLADIAKVLGVAIGVVLVGAFARATLAVIQQNIRVATLTAQKLALAGATTTAARSMAAFGAAVRIATGPIGIIITVLGTLALSYREIKTLTEQAEEATGGLSEEVKRLTGNIEDLQTAQLQEIFTRAAIQAEEAERDIENISRRIERLQSNIETGNLPPGASTSVAQQELERLEQQLDEARESLTDADDAVVGILERMAELQNESGNTGGELEKFARGAKENFDSLIESLNEFARDAAFDAIERARKMADAIQNVRDEIADASAELGGPLARNLRNFQSEVQRIAQLDVPEALKAERIALLREEFDRTNIEIRDGLIRTFEDAISGALPTFIQQMLGLADATDRVAQASRGLDFGRIGSGFAQSIFQGQNPVDALSSALIGSAGQGLSDQFGAIFEDGFKGALENLGDPETWKPSAEGFTLALGQAIQGNLGQGVATAIGSFFGPVGTAVGSLFGGLLDGLFGGSTPKFQVRGLNATRATDAGTDQVIGTLFGDIEFAFRKIDEQAQNELIRIFDSFFDSLGGIVRDVGRRADIEEIVQRFGISSRSGPDTPEQQLNLLLDDILAGAFSAFEAEFVNFGNTLEERLQRLSELFAITNETIRGNDLGLSFESLLTTLDELRIANEPLQQTFARLSETVGVLDQASALLNTQFADSREGLLQFGADLVALFGDDAGALSGLANKVFGFFFDEFERAAATVENGKPIAESLIRTILDGVEGIDFSEDFLTQSGFRELLDILTSGDFDISPEDLARLLEAGGVLVDVIEAENLLAEARGDTTRDAAKIADILAGLELDAAAAGLEGLDLALFRNNLQFDELRERLIELGATDEELAKLAELRADANDRLRQSEEQRLQQERENLLQTVGDQALAVIAPTRLEFARLNRQLAENEARAKELGLSEEQLRIVRLSAQIQLQGFIAGLSESIASLTEQLFGAGDASEQAGNDIQRNIRNMRDAWLSAIDQIRGALDDQLVGPNSSLTRAEQQQEAVSQFNQALAAAQGGDVDAARDLPQLFNQAIAQSAGFFGTSTDDFAQIEEQLRSALESANLPVPPQSPEVRTAQNTAQIERNTFDQLGAAFNLVDQIGILSMLTEQSPAEIGEQFGIPIADLIEILTGEVPDLTGDALAGFFNDLVSEANQQLNELAQLEQTTALQLGQQFRTNALLESILKAVGRQSDPVGFAGAEFGGSGEAGGVFVPPPSSSVTSIGDSESKQLLASIDAKLEAGNADRRAGTELTAEEIAALKELTRERLRVDRTELSGRPSRRRTLGT